MDEFQNNGTDRDNGNKKHRYLAGRVPQPGKRQVRMTLPNPRSEKVRRRVANSVARLNQSQEADALRWIEAVSEFDERETR